MSYVPLITLITSITLITFLDRPDQRTLFEP